MKRISALFIGLCLLVSSISFANSRDTYNDELKNSLRSTFLMEVDQVIVTDDAVTFRDASSTNGNVVTIAKNPQKVVNLYASFTTLWYEAGGTVNGCIGGNSSIELYKEYIGRDITKDGGVNIVATTSAGKNWDIEKIISLQPDLIISSTAMSGYATMRAPAEAAKIPMIAVSYNDFADYLKWFKVFCNLNDRADLWESVALKALDEVIDVLIKSPTENNPRVFSMFSGANSLQANTSNTVVGSMLTSMNAINIVDSWANTTDAERLEINLETIYVADPDAIIIQCHSEIDLAKDQVAKTYGSNPVWQSLRAVREDKVFYLEKALFHNKPNRRFAESYKVLAEVLYPGTEF